MGLLNKQNKSNIHVAMCQTQRMRRRYYNVDVLEIIRDSYVFSLWQCRFYQSQNEPMPLSEWVKMIESIRPILKECGSLTYMAIPAGQIIQFKLLKNDSDICFVGGCVVDDECGENIEEYVDGLAKKIK